ncbi:hypothetical protein RSSM_01953 [Rhodopirellula sallentina SM41]|uniref:Uncharacterized protein n=1 Tax=Rhodopirellula sallentina SM41 TaxID=1263870 RepID=M5U5A2_9BACT|nr:hypothetical protein RSSM_01953 [Rhodopirellula sallentina SM41]
MRIGRSERLIPAEPPLHLGESLMSAPPVDDTEVVRQSVGEYL